MNNNNRFRTLVDKELDQRRMNDKLRHLIALAADTSTTPAERLSAAVAAKKLLG